MSRVERHIRRMCARLPVFRAGNLTMADPCAPLPPLQLDSTLGAAYIGMSKVHSLPDPSNIAFRSFFQET